MRQANMLTVFLSLLTASFITTQVVTHSNFLMNIVLMLTTIKNFFRLALT